MDIKPKHANATLQSSCMWVPSFYPKESLPSEEFPFMTLQLQVIVIFCVTQFLHRFIFAHVGLPRLASQLMAGVLLSPDVIMGKYKITKEAYDIIFPSASDEVWRCVALLGWGFSMFIFAVRTDFTMIKKSGMKPIIIGLLVLVVPMTAATWFTNWINTHGLIADPRMRISLEASSNIFPASSFTVTAILLHELKLLNSELGRLAICVSVVADISSVVFLSLSKGWSQGHLQVPVFVYLGKAAALVGIVFFYAWVVRSFLYKKVIERTPKGRPVSPHHVVLVVLLMFMGTQTMRLTNLSVTSGFFFVGVTIPEGPPLGSAVFDKFYFFVMELLVPFFLTNVVRTSKLSTLVQLKSSKLLMGHLGITLIAISMKMLVCWTLGLYYNMAASDALALGAIMNARGIIDMGVYLSLSDAKALLDESLAYLVIVVLILSVVVPLSVKWLYNPLRKYAGYRARDIMHCKAESKLRVLACIFRSDNVSSITKLLTLAISADSPNPIVVDILHLTRLVGRTQPIFVSHDVQDKVASSDDDIRWAFNGFERATKKIFSMHFYTAVSPPNLMHSDICTLALDNEASLIILPYHRKLSFDGMIDFEDPNQRALNHSMFEQAPCSVGILLDRGIPRLGKTLIKSSPTKEPLSEVYVHRPEEDNGLIVRVAVIFIGGKDDQEAVAYARRLATGSMVRVHVIQLVTHGTQDLSLMDQIAISGFQDHGIRLADQRFQFSKKEVADGPETAALLTSMAGCYDLIIVGRRYNMDCPQTSSLKLWSEVPEIGILGDLLASTDLPGRTSVLIIQQQKVWTWKRIPH